MNFKTALDLIGGLSEPSKMPCYGYSIPASTCKIGAKLKNVAGSVCNKCYAMRGNYMFRTVQASLMKRFKSLSNPFWVRAMTVAITKKVGTGYFRWHDSGDIQSVGHLKKIIQVCNNLPDIKFWLPTREYAIISKYLAKGGKFPVNLTVRLSSLMIDGPAPTGIATRFNLVTSGVSSNGNFTCPASQQGNKCQDCRACWDKNVPNIGYKKH